MHVSAGLSRVVRLLFARTLIERLIELETIMPGPCPQGYPTQDAHESARCRDRGSCAGPGCRLRRDKRRDPLPAED